jgi:large subunit ribosomal protein L29
MTIDELRALATAELRAKLDETRDEYMKLRFQFTMGQLSDYTRLKVVRRNIARIETLLRERELAAEGEGQQA